MSPEPSASRLIDRIVKLFKLGSRSANTTEAETLAAITKAKQLMAEHAIAEHDVQQALNAEADRNKRARIDVTRRTAYTRKMTSLARYDEIVALCVQTLTSTRALLRQTHTLNGRYVSMDFIGEEVDSILASELFMIFLPEVRRAARQMFGSARWTLQHTSYAIGYATRMLDRARAMVSTLTPTQQSTMALVVQNKESAIQAYMNALELKKITKSDAKRRVDNTAFHQGYRDGASFNLTTRAVGQRKPG
jgi:hypothetical protein